MERRNSIFTGRKESEMPQTLLDKAKESEAQGITPELIDLSISWALGEVKTKQAMKAIGGDYYSCYSKIAKALAFYIKNQPKPKSNGLDF